MTQLAVRSYDTIVIGGCLSGLLASTYLAVSGKRVALFEKKFSLQDEDLAMKMHQEFKFSPNPPVLSLPQAIIQDLKLHDHVPTHKHSGVTSITPLSTYDGEQLLLGQNPLDSIRHFAPGDAERYNDFIQEMKKTDESSQQVSCKEILNDYFDFGPLKATLAAKMCSSFGPEIDTNHPKSGQVLRKIILQELKYPLRTLASKDDSFIPYIRRKAVSHGVDIFCGGGVREILSKRNQISGIILANGLKSSCSNLIAPLTTSTLTSFKTEEGLTDTIYIFLQKSFLRNTTNLGKMFAAHPGCPLYFNCEDISHETGPSLIMNHVKSQSPDQEVVKVSVFSPHEKCHEDIVMALLENYLPGLSNAALGMIRVNSSQYISSKLNGLYLYSNDCGISGKKVAEALIQSEPHSGESNVISNS